MDKEISKVLKKLEYGVYVVTIGNGNDGNAFTASWFTQVSSEPPMVTLAVKNEHQSVPLLNRHRSFVVNLIGKSQVEVAKMYYGPAESGYEKLKSASITESPVSKTPVLNGAVAFIDCKIIKTVPAGNL